MIEAINTPESQSPIQKGNFLIAGLGNPGREYEKSRHNAGFMLVNRLASRLGESFKRVEGRSLICKTTYNGERLILIKPQTYMNNSGSAVSTILRYYKVPLENLLVVYDDVDLPLGTLRLRGSGGSAGQKGMQSIIERLGTEEFSRLRIGTGRPPGRKEAADYVLEDFPPDEADLLKETLDRGVEAVLAFITDGLDKTMTSFNG